MLQREKQPMPEYVRDALEESGVVEDYEARPEYQRNDYLMWISNAKRDETKRKRLNQMIDELRRGGVYMNTEHPASRKT